METTLYERLLNAGFRYVSYRLRSEREIRDFLQKTLNRWKAAGQRTVDNVVDRLKEYGYVDDVKFSLWWIDQRRTFRPKGEMAIRAELYKKGIAREVVDTAFFQRKSGEEAYDELTSARKVILKKIAKIGQMSIIEQKKRLYTFLAQRGFSRDTIGKIIDESTKKDYN